MKFRAHDTFFIRKGWISKGMRYVDKSKGEVFISKSENPMDVLGIGANMVKALRYWLQAIGITEEPKSGRRTQKFTDFGKLVFEHDKYIEEMGTLYLLHYKLASNREQATSWYFFFNEFGLSDFTKDDFAVQIGNFIKINDKDANVAARSIDDDFSCIINTYVPRYKTMPSKVTAENNIDCPLGELGLIDILKKERNNIVYKKAIPPAATFNSWVILAVIYDNAKGRKEIELNELLTAENNIGKTFNLDSITMLDVLHAAERTGELKIVRTAGLDVINLVHSYTFEDCVKHYYEEMEKAE
ncbi:DUF4007 family protein [Ihubacter sp. mB4P-1]|uniref:DUF4007 family protein n=1 Tax=Ihubacter sp. mB4P-1 TaxID=3242370 RepID=UPI003C7A4C6E